MKKKDYYFIIGCLCFFSGFINIVTLFYFGYAISHFSGTFTSIAKCLYVNINSKELFRLLIMVISFVIGAIFSGIISSDSQEKNLKKYGEILIAFGISILILKNFAKNNQIFLYFLTLTMGFQNAMNIRFKESLIRSTHMTGNLTDLGNYLGKVLKGEKDKLQHVFLSFFEIEQYILGGVIALMCLFYFKDCIIILYSILYTSCGIFMIKK